jgi:hypothetical protein
MGNFSFICVIATVNLKLFVQNVSATLDCLDKEQRVLLTAKPAFTGAYRFRRCCDGRLKAITSDMGKTMKQSL